jgi:hypothetical protein
MARPQRIKKTVDETLRDFRHTFGFILLSSQAYDNGYKGEAARLAAVVYMLVHDYGKSAVSLLKQMGRKNIDFVNTSVSLNPRNLLTEMPLVIMRLTAGQGKDSLEYLPRLAENPQPIPNPILPFEKWWNMPVIRDDHRRTISRKNIVFHMRHSEAGAHVDSSIDGVFADIRRVNSMGWVVSTNEGNYVPEYGPEYASMRQIAWEVEQTLRRNFQDLIPA